MKARIKAQKPTVEVPTSREQAEAVLLRVAELKSAEAAAKAAMDAELARVRESYQADLADIAAQIASAVQALELWAERNQSLFGRLRSLVMLHGRIGWRTNPPSLKPLRGLTWNDVLETLRRLGRREFIRVKEEPDREALLAAREHEDLRALGCRVEQVEEFFVEPELTPVEQRETSPSQAS
jgi:phage host-nuclease inhibitor protein Gam